MGRLGQGQSSPSVPSFPPALLPSPFALFSQCLLGILHLREGPRPGPGVSEMEKPPVPNSELRAQEGLGLGWRSGPLPFSKASLATCGLNRQLQ